MEISKRKLTLPRLFSNGMVLQRGEPVRLWGWTSPWGAVRICFLGEEYSATADETGVWNTFLPAQKPGGPYCIEFTAGETIILQDIWVGDVWICSGQSNMVLPMVRVRDLYEEDIALSYNLAIRFFTVPDRCEFNQAQEDFSAGQWEWPNPESVLHFGATAYFFARSLFERYHVPIGIINASVGGSPLEAWMSREALQVRPHYLAQAEPFKSEEYICRIQEHNNAVQSDWHTRLNQEDEGLREQPQWSAEVCDDKEWQTMTLPGRWADAQPGDIHGALWFRREFDIPAAWAGHPAQLRMGRIIDSDTVYVNGLLVGTTGYQYPPRKYAIPGNVLKAGKNVISVRVVNTLGQGGFAEGKPYEIRIGDERVVNLAGEWRFRIGATAPELPKPVWLSRQPTSLFNGMLSPAVSYTVKGFVWYQGESNTGSPQGYQTLLEAMIADVRAKWNKPALPFLIAQLPNYEDEDPACKEGWPLIREQQRQALRIPNTGLAVAIDTGEWNDLHPLGKKPIGIRLALLAQKLAYGEEIISSGPMAKSAERQGSFLKVHFSPDCGGITTMDGKIPGRFEIADETGVFFPANAEIEAHALRVWNDKVSSPTAVRYAWADNPQGANLCGSTGLPASPFRIEL